MRTIHELTWQGATTGRWVARIAGSFSILLVLALLIGEGFPDLGRMTKDELLVFVGLGCVVLGLAVAWLWEAWGGLLAVIGWTFLSLLGIRLTWGWGLAIPAVGLLHLLSWWRLRGPAPAQAPAAEAESHFKLQYVFWLLPVVFLLLCTNEIFVNPPLMARSVRPVAEMAGAWSTVLSTVSGQVLPTEIPVVLNIGADGSVRGAIGNAKLTAGRLEPNRSWFGRLMQWRTEYIVRGALSQPVESWYGDINGDQFKAPVNPSGQDLAGSLFLSHPGPPKPLGLRLRRQ
jgi:hypothetical protein